MKSWKNLAGLHKFYVSSNYTAGVFKITHQCCEHEHLNFFVQTHSGIVLIGCSHWDMGFLWKLQLLWGLIKKEESSNNQYVCKV